MDQYNGKIKAFFFANSGFRDANSWWDVPAKNIVLACGDAGDYSATSVDLFVYTPNNDVLESLKGSEILALDFSIRINWTYKLRKERVYYTVDEDWRVVPSGRTEKL
jgi:hypothetical protein